MARAEIRNGYISVDVPHREAALIKRVPGSKWRQQDLRWRLPLSWSSCLALRGVFGEALEIDRGLSDWAWAEVETRVDPALDWRREAMDPTSPAPHNNGLYPYQQTAVEFLKAAGSALLADEPGVGKTPTTIAAVEAWPLLVVCPKSVVWHWHREIEKWAGVEALVLEGTAPQRAKAFDNYIEQGHAVIVSYDLLRTHSRLAAYGSLALSEKEKAPGLLNTVEWGTVIADEAHRAKDPRAKQTRALWAVGDSAQHRFALTGTPIANNTVDLWALLRFISPEEWPSKTAFLDRYCDVSLSHWGGMEVHGLKRETRAEFDRIFEPRYLRRTKELVLKHLPLKVYQRREIDLPPKLARAYREMQEGMVAEIENGTLTTFDPLVQGMRLVQMASSSMEDGPAGPRMCEPSPKLDELLAVLEDLGDAPCPVFSSSRQLLDLAAARLDKHGISYSQIVGGQAGWERQDAIDAYNSGKVRCLLVSLGAGAEGFSLTRGSHAVFLDRSWSQVQNIQAEDRLHGTGRGDALAQAITYIDITTRGTIEAHRYEVLGDKTDALQDVVRDRATLLRLLGQK